jgi:hypothetical protein
MKIPDYIYQSKIDELFDNLSEIGIGREGDSLVVREWLSSLAAAPTPPAQKAEPVAWTERQIELIDGMIDAQKYHSERMSQIGNRVMGDKQIGWNTERIEILQKAKNLTITPSDKLRQAAEEFITAHDTDNGVDWVDALENLRAELEKKS